VVHRRDDEGVGMAHKIISPKNQFYQTMIGQHTNKGQYWFKLSINKLSECFQKVATEFLNTNCLMPSD